VKLFLIRNGERCFTMIDSIIIVFSNFLIDQVYQGNEMEKRGEMGW